MIQYDCSKNITARLKISMKKYDYKEMAERDLEMVIGTLRTAGKEKINKEDIEYVDKWLLLWGIKDSVPLS